MTEIEMEYEENNELFYILGAIQYIPNFTNPQNDIGFSFKEEVIINKIISVNEDSSENEITVEEAAMRLSLSTEDFLNKMKQELYEKWTDRLIAADERRQEGP